MPPKEAHHVQDARLPERRNQAPEALPGRQEGRRQEAVAQAPILFYSTRGPYGFLSNFHRCLIVLDGCEWRTSEHFYQAQKVVSSEGARGAAFYEILDARSPGEAARLGRNAPLRPDWREVREAVMWRVLLAKFTQHADLAARLLATAPAGLIEDSPRDAYWGIGKDGDGWNRLGVMLGEVRGVVGKYGW